MKHYREWLLRGVALLSVLMLAGCQSMPEKTNLYDELGGMAVIEKITGNFIVEVGYDQRISRFYADSDLNRFYEKMVEYLCAKVDGPCTYEGEAMDVVHAGMNINEAQFNAVVDLLVNAMNRSGVPHRLQNRVLARLAPTREQIIYR